VFATAVSLILVSYNFRNAVGMSATMHQAAQENYEQKVKENENDQKRIDGKQGTYDEAVKIAGYVSVEDYEKQIIALQTTGYRTARWEGIGSTDHCNPLYIKTRDARELCNRFNDLDRKKGAAKSRDWLYGEIKNLQDTQPKPIRTRLDAEMENLGVLIGMFGYSLDADGKKTLKSAIDWQIGLLAEVIGTAGPEIVLLLFMMFDPRAAERERRKKAERKADRDSLRIEREARQDEKRKEAARRRAEKAEKAKPIPAVEPEINRPELKPEEMDESDPQATAFLNRNTARVIGGRVPPKKTL
jgi:hypothetical protein